MMRLPKKRERVRSNIPRAPQREWPRHRKFIRTLTCSVGICPSSMSPCRIECAHVRSGTDGGISRKPSDWWTLPLCHLCHRRQHEMGEASFERAFRLDMKAIALGLARQHAKTYPEFREAMRQAGVL